MFLASPTVLCLARVGDGWMSVEEGEERRWGGSVKKRERREGRKPVSVVCVRGKPVEKRGCVGPFAPRASV